MLDNEKPDCVYIAVTNNDHYLLTMMCAQRGIPVLCEKAMFQNSDEAQKVFEAAARNKVFVMEAMWSRFLPAVNKAKMWIDNGEIGIPEISQFSIGFAAPEDKENRYFNPLLGGGAAKDITGESSYTVEENGTYKQTATVDGLKADSNPMILLSSVDEEPTEDEIDVVYTKNKFFLKYKILSFFLINIMVE